MADEDTFLPPLEVPWRLASTTLPFSNGEPDQTSISLFTYVPDDEVLTAKFPDEKLVYIKITASISPASFPIIPPFPSGALGEGIPVYHVLLDLKVRRKSGENETIRPYFHSAAPLKRRMIQSGVVGHEIFEGEASGQFMGKSGSEMHEALNSESRTTSLSASLGVGVGIGPVSIGASGSVRTTSTDVTANRAVTQNVDTTTRQASDERREIVSHSTKVENILSLLNAKYVGTPFLSFSLNPRPLNLLSLDPSDPNLWFSQLLARRSSGIEGVQEFTAVIVVPKDVDFCVSARLRRVCLFDTPPGPLTFDESYTDTPTQLGRVLNYLDRTYPSGTSVDELDVEVLVVPPPPPPPPQPLTKPPQDKFPRPVIEFWEFAGFQGTFGGWVGALARLISPTAGFFPNTTSRIDAFYKHPLELWLDVLRDEYETDVARSPLERGVLLSETRTLDTCFVFSEAALNVSNSTASVVPLAPLAINPAVIDIGGVRGGALDPNRDVRARGIEIVTRWNVLEAQLANILNNRRTFPKEPKLNDMSVVGVLVERWAKLRPQDSDNVDFNTAVSALGLSAAHRRLLKSAGATDLRSIARALEAAPTVENYNAKIQTREESDRTTKSIAEPIAFAISAAKAHEMRRAISVALAKSLETKSKE
jgi:hypothetical protein